MKRLAGLVRITSGEFRGRALKSPADPGVHPMGARERLSLLNALASDLPGARVLDAYAGTGAIGLECLSRGARSATFIEASPGVAKVLKENIHQLGLERETSILTTTVEKLTAPGQILSPRAPKLRSFQVVVADPPYDAYDPAAVARLEGFLRPGGVLAVSHPRGSEAPEFAGLRLVSWREMAGCRVSIFRG